MKTLKVTWNNTTLILMHVIDLKKVIYKGTKSGVVLFFSLKVFILGLAPLPGHSDPNVHVGERKQASFRTTAVLLKGKTYHKIPVRDTWPMTQPVTGVGIFANCEKETEKMLASHISDAGGFGPYRCFQNHNKSSIYRPEEGVWDVERTLGSENVGILLRWIS